MADKPQSFATWIAQQGSHAGTRSPVDVSAIATATNGRSWQQRETEERGSDPQDPLSWLIDILTRPLSGVTNVVQSGINRSAQQTEAFRRGDFGGQVEAAARGIFPVGDFLSGMLSTDPSQHRTFSDVIEQSTDVLGGATDPNYVDAQDNVLPAVKGGVGLALDIAADPLMWIPGAQIAKIAGTGARGVKALVGGGQKIAKGLSSGAVAALAARKARAVDDLAPEAAALGGNADEIAKAVTKAGDNVPPARETPEQQLTRELEADLGVPGISKGKPAPVPDSVADQIKVHPRTTKMVEIIDDLARVRPRALPQTNGAPGQVLDSKSWWDEFQRLATDSPNHVGFIKVKSNVYDPVTGHNREISFEDVRRILDPASTYSPSLKKAVQDTLTDKYVAYREAFDRAQSGAKPTLVDALSRTVRPIKAGAESAPETETLVRQLERYQELLAQDVARVESALGVGLTDQLRRMSNPDRFDQIIQQMGDILRPTDDLSSITDLTGQPALRKLFQTLDIDPLAINAARQTTSNVGKVNVVEMFDRMKDPKLGAAADTIDQDVLAALPGVVESNFFKLDAYAYTTAGGTAKTAEGIGAGLGRNERAMNTHFQYTFGKNLIERAAARVRQDPRGKAGPGRAALMDAEVTPAILKGEALLDQHGLPLYLDFGGQKLPISMGQTLEVLREDSLKLMQQTLYNVETSVPMTNLLDAVFFAVKKDASWDVVNAQLAKVNKRNMKQGEIPNPLMSGGAGQLRYGYLSKRVTTHPPVDTEDFKYVFQKSKTNPVGGWYKVWDADRIRARLTTAIMRQVPKMKEIAAQNAEAYSARLGAETLDLTTQEIKVLEALIREPDQLGVALQQMGTVESRIQKSAHEAGAIKESSDLAKVLVTESAPGLAVENAKGASKVSAAGQRGASKAAKAKKSPKAQAVGAVKEAMPSAQRVFNAQADAAARMVDEVEDAISPIYREIQAGKLGKLDPLNRALNYKAGMSHVYDLMGKQGALHGWWVADRHRKLNELSRAFPGNIPGTSTPILRQAFQDVQRGVTSTNAQVAEASVGVSKLMDDLMDLSGEAPVLGNAFFRNNVNIDHLNFAMERAGLGFQIDLDDAARLAQANGTDILVEASKQWRTWAVEDPADFISKLSHSAMRLFTDVSVGQSFTRRAVREGWAITEARKGYSIAEDHSAITAAISKDLYIRDDILAELTRLESVMYSSTTPDGSLGKFLTEAFDPLQRAWKKLITVFRPGHHVRNEVGDASVQFVAEGSREFLRAGKNAFKIMGLRNNYRDVDVVKALNELGEYKLAGQGDVISSGKFGDLTASDIYDSAMRSGLFQVGRVVEDIVGSGGGKFAQLVDKAALTGTRPEQLVMGVSEFREHYARLHHFLQIIQKAQKDGKFFDGFTGTKYPKTIDGLLATAAERVKRYHPDASMLSNFERTYMRRIIPFYSWYRGILPAIAETLVLQPGRVMAFPKSSYNLAVMMGVNPDSMSDPFPEDQLFPSFLTEQMLGPQFKVGDSYFSINPGMAHVDVLNMFGRNPLRSTAGMVSPLLRMPAELLSGGSWATGTRIKDPSDYIDSSLPGINYLANISGFSPTGSVASLAGGNGLDPQYQQAAGNKNETDQLLSAINWLTGFGVNNMSRPNYINFAEIEKRNREGGKTVAF